MISSTILYSNDPSKIEVCACCNRIEKLLTSTSTVTLISFSFFSSIGGALSFSCTLLSFTVVVDFKGSK